MNMSVLLALVEEAYEDCIGSRGDHDDYTAAKALGSLSYVIRKKLAAQGIEAGTGETPSAARSEGREPDGEADAPENKTVDPYALGGGK